MPSGDAQRVWFPEMLEALRSTWSKEMTWVELVDFCRRMTERRKAIRHSRGIRPPKTRCPGCGRVSRTDISGVSVRSALFALKKDGIINEVEFKALDKSWKKYRAEHNLDPYGQRPAAPCADGKDGDPRC